MDSSERVIASNVFQELEVPHMVKGRIVLLGDGEPLFQPPFLGTSRVTNLLLTSGTRDDFIFRTGMSILSFLILERQQQQQQTWISRPHAACGLQKLTLIY